MGGIMSIEEMNTVLFNTQSTEEEDLFEATFSEEEYLVMAGESAAQAATIATCTDSYATFVLSTEDEEAAEGGDEDTTEGEETSTEDEDTGSDEDDTSTEEEKKPNGLKQAWKKFWDMVTAFFNKIREMIGNIINRVKIWMTGDGKKFKNLYNEVKDKISDIEKSEVTVKVLPFAKDASRQLLATSGSNGKFLLEIKTLLEALKKDGATVTTQEVEKSKKLREEMSTLNASVLKEKLYGKDPKRSDVKVSEFIKSFTSGIKHLESVGSRMADHKKLLDNASSVMKKSLNEAKKNAAKASPVKADVKVLVSNVNAALQISTSASLFTISTEISRANALASAVRAAYKELGKKKKDDKKKDEEKK